MNEPTKNFDLNFSFEETIREHPLQPFYMASLLWGLIKLSDKNQEFNINEEYQKYVKINTINGRPVGPIYFCDDSKTIEEVILIR